MSSSTDYAAPVPPPAELPDASQRLLAEVLSVVRVHLGMEVAFIGRVVDGRRTFTLVDADECFRPFEAGMSDPVEDTYCGRVLDGRLPRLVVDAALEPAVADLSLTTDLPVGSHLSVPVLTAEGELYGTLCCFSRKVDPGLSEHDLSVLLMFADIVSKHLEPLVSRHRSRSATRERIRRVIEEEGALRMALQPIVDLRTGRVDGFEALARFPESVGWSPDRWFEAADRVGLGTELEAAAAEAAIELLPLLAPGQKLAVNVSTPALLDGTRLADIFTGSGRAERLVLEITESHHVATPDRLARILDEVRATGVQVAVDDAGAGYAGLERILALHPEVLKLDRSLVHGIARHRGRQAMCEAMVSFTARTGSRLVAEGVELRSDLASLRDLEVGHAQGYLLGRPTVWPLIIPLARQASG